MTTYILTIACVSNGNLEYNVIEEVNTDFSNIKVTASRAATKQAYIWGVKPEITKMVKGYQKEVTVKHPSQDYKKIYTLTAYNN